MIPAAANADRRHPMIVDQMAEGESRSGSVKTTIKLMAFLGLLRMILGVVGGYGGRATERKVLGLNIEFGFRTVEVWMSEEGSSSTPEKAFLYLRVDLNYTGIVQVRNFWL